MKDINRFDFKNQKILLRVDFNVPINEDGKIIDKTRIKLVIPTIKKILNDGGKIIIISHLGNPNEINRIIREKYSLKKILKPLSQYLNMNIKFYHDCIGDEVVNIIKLLKSKEIILLENLRFYKEEKNADTNFAQQLSLLGDIYINEAFSMAHRYHASNYILPKFFKKKYFGFLFKKEITSLNNILKNNNKNHLITCIIGGSKISSKITMINNLLDKINYLIIGGGMAYTFIKAQGGNIGNSIVENNKLDLARNIINKAKLNNVLISLPNDSIISNKFNNNDNTQIVLSKNIPNGWFGMDIGPLSINTFSKIINISNKIFWNGPLGVVEFSNFSHGTMKILDIISNITKQGAFSIIGGGDTIGAINNSSLKQNISYISTGGGAMLAFLEGKKLPGIYSMFNR